MTYNVTAKRWAHGWELHIDGVGVTQSRTLANAEAVVRDYLELDDYEDHATAEVVVTPSLGGFEERVWEVREHTRAAERAQREAAQEAREVARKLRSDGLSVTDTAAVLGVSRGRVSQLVS